MEFDRLTVVVLMAIEGASMLDEDAAATLQDHHLAFLAKLHADGVLVAAGPAAGPSGGHVRGFSLFRLPPEEALQVSADDPLVLAGRITLEAHDWMVPAGAVHFSPTHFPESVAEVMGT